MEVLNVVAVLVAGLMVGCELSVAAFVHPVLDRLPDDVHLKAASSLAKVLGKFMPFWYILVLLLTVADGLVQAHSGRLPIFFILSGGLWLLTILFTITALVPINNRIGSWTTVTPPSDWKTYRSRWDRFHRWRVVYLTIAFIFLIVGVVTSRTQ